MQVKEKLTVIVPAFNEGNNIFNNLLEIHKTISSFAPNNEIIAVDDGSSDDTFFEIERAAKKNNSITPLRYENNLGKGGALQYGTSHSGSEGYIAFVDADLDLHPKQLASFFVIMKEQNADVVIGSKLHPDSVIHYPKSRRVFSLFYYYLINVLFNLKTKDTQTGLKLFKASVIKPLMEKVLVKRFAFDLEVLTLCRKNEYKICEAPVQLDFSRGNGFGRIKFKDIWHMFHDTLAIFYRLKILKYYDIQPEKKAIVFFIGTEAEFIKVFPVIIEAKKTGSTIIIIASGQNNIAKSAINRHPHMPEIDFVLSEEKAIKKSALGLFKWFIKLAVSSKKRIVNHFPNIQFDQSVMVVHGDTVSTVLGARLGKKLNMKVAHIEAGLRSHHLFSPFPEEIDRMITSRYANMHFAPGEAYIKNLENVKGKKINTFENTLFDSLKIASAIDCKDALINKLIASEYFVVVLHRQENLVNQELMKTVVSEVLSMSKEKACVFVMHQITKIALQKNNLYQALLDNPNITLIGRTEFFDFVKLLEHALFVITDGGSNQEELSYMGKPCLILRSHTEREEGLGENALLLNGDLSLVKGFFTRYKAFERPAYRTINAPSKIIAETLCDLFSD